MNIAEQEDDLFDEWAMFRRPFVRDGVPCEEEYLASKRKTAFVLKEYANEVDGTYDLRKKLQCPYGPGWWKVARVQHGICEMDLPEKDRRKFDKKMPPSICAFHLDKRGGHSRTNMMWLALIAMDDRKFIERQFKIYEPDLTICGGTFEVFRYMFRHGAIEEKTTSGGYRWYERSSKKYVVGINHPAYPAQSPEAVLKAIKEIYQLNGS